MKIPLWVNVAIINQRSATILQDTPAGFGCARDAARVAVLSQARPTCTRRLVAAAKAPGK